MPDYWRVVTGCIARVALRTGAAVIVRHLLMPGHFDCCTAPALSWLATQPTVQVSLLTQYLAPAHARGALAAPLPRQRWRGAAAGAVDLGLRLVR
jgi:uncharacterized Fe-S radical SAM superfamily protein PflX